MERILLFLFLATASYEDIRYRRIGNREILLFFISGLITGYVSGGPEKVTDAVMTAAIVFILLFAFFVIGCLGAGDIKFIMAAGAFTGHEGLIRSLIPITVSAVLLAVFQAVKERKIKGLSIPMAVPISAGLFFGTQGIL